MRRFRAGVTTLLAVTLVAGTSACSSGQAPTSAPKERPRAVYLAPQEGGQLTEEDLASHPEVSVVHSQHGLRSAVGTGTPVWIDKDALSMVDFAWVRSMADQNCPIALVGWGDWVLLHKLVYDNHSRRLGEPSQGFCVIVNQGPAVSALEASSTSDIASPPDVASPYARGFDETPTVGAILAVTDRLARGEEFPR